LALRQISYWSPSQEIVEKEEDTSNIESQEKLTSSSYKQEILCSLPATQYTIKDFIERETQRREEKERICRGSLSYKVAIIINSVTMK